MEVQGLGGQVNNNLKHSCRQWLCRGCTVQSPSGHAATFVTKAVPCGASIVSSFRLCSH